MTGRAGSIDEHPNGGRQTGRILLAGLLGLALAATAILVLSESTQVLRIGVLAGLWAALIGGLVAAKYRGQVTERRNEVSDLQEIYELELEREVSARREYELELEADVRSEVAEEHTKQLDALRAEMRVLRENLEALVGGEVLVERVALRAESTRMRSLQDGSGRAGQHMDSQRMDSQRQRALQASQMVDGGVSDRQPERPAVAQNGRAGQPQNGQQTMRAEPVQPPAGAPQPRRQEPPKRRPAPSGAEQQRRVPNPAQQQATQQQRPQPPPQPSAETQVRKPVDPSTQQPAAQQAPAQQPPPSQARRPEPEPTQRWDPAEVARSDGWQAQQQAAQPPAARQQPAQRQPAQQPAQQQPPQQPAQQQPARQSDLPRREPGANRQERPAWASDGLDPNWTPSWENGQSNGKQADPVANGNGRGSGIPSDERPPAGRTAGSRHGRSEDGEEQVQSWYSQDGAAYATPSSSGGGRRRKPDPEEAAPSGGRRRKPDPEDQPSAGGRRRKPDEYADPSASGGWTIRESANGNNSGNGNGHARPETSNGHAAPAGEDRGAHSDGKSVSELLAAYGDSGGGRRRRRED